MSTQDDPGSRRRDARVAVDFPVTVILPGHELVLGGAALDLSEGGMRVATTSDLPPGQRVVVRFAFPSGAHDVLVHGVIVLSFYDARRCHYAHGIAFTQYTERDKAAIAAFIRDRLGAAP